MGNAVRGVNDPPLTRQAMCTEFGSLKNWKPPRNLNLQLRTKYERERTRSSRRVIHVKRSVVPTLSVQAPPVA